MSKTLIGGQLCTRRGSLRRSIHAPMIVDSIPNRLGKSAIAPARASARLAQRRKFTAPSIARGPGMQRAPHRLRCRNPTRPLLSRSTSHLDLAPRSEGLQVPPQSRCQPMQPEQRGTGNRSRTEGQIVRTPPGAPNRAAVGFQGEQVANQGSDRRAPQRRATR
jgi:hypothetical protein